MGVIKVTSADFEQVVLRSTVPVVVHFSAQWCWPCKRLAPVLEQLAAEYGEKVLITKIDIDEDPDLAERYKVESIPLVVILTGGEERLRSTGFVLPESLKAAIDPLPANQAPSAGYQANLLQSIGASRQELLAIMKENLEIALAEDQEFASMVEGLKQAAQPLLDAVQKEMLGDMVKRIAGEITPEEYQRRWMEIALRLSQDERYKEAAQALEVYGRQVISAG